MLISLTPPFLLALAVGYLIGSVPFGLLLTRAAGLGDIRGIGSGNIGATNVLRTGHKGLAAATLALDMLKGTLAVLLAKAGLMGLGVPGPTQAFAAGFGAFLGHIYPMWLGFRGGKGVATYIGVLLGILPVLALIFCVIWLGTAWLTRYSSLSALVASIAAPAVAWALGWPEIGVLMVPLTALLLLKHRANIERLLQGTEPRIGGKV